MPAPRLRGRRRRGQRGVVAQVVPGDDDAGDDRAGGQGASEPPRRTGVPGPGPGGWLPRQAEVEYPRAILPGCDPLLATARDDAGLSVWLLDGDQPLSSARLTS